MFFFNNRQASLTRKAYRHACRQIVQIKTDFYRSDVASVPMVLASWRENPGFHTECRSRRDTQISSYPSGSGLPVPNELPTALLRRPSTLRALTGRFASAILLARKNRLHLVVFFVGCDVMPANNHLYWIFLITHGDWA